MSSVIISGDVSGAATLQAPSAAGSPVITLPTTSGTLASIASVNNNGVLYANGSGQPTTNTSFVFDGTNLGVGTSSPSTYGKFTTSTTTDKDGVNVIFPVAPTGTNGPALNFWNNSNIALYKGAAIQGICTNGGGSGYSDMTFSTTYNGVLSEAFRIMSTGDMLVGTTTTNGKLTVVGNGTTALFSKSSGATSATYATIFRNSADTNLFYARGDGAIALPVTYGSWTTASAANVYIASDGVLYRSTSSLKYKRDVENATHGLSDVMQLRPVTYKGKSETDGEAVFGGLIAEEVHDAGLTEFVQYAEDGTPDALAYGPMVSLCIKAIQELKADLDATKAELATLKGQA